MLGIKRSMLCGTCEPLIYRHCVSEAFVTPDMEMSKASAFIWVKMQMLDTMPVTRLTGNLQCRASLCHAQPDTVMLKRTF